MSKCVRNKKKWMECVCVRALRDYENVGRNLNVSLLSSPLLFSVKNSPLSGSSLSWTSVSVFLPWINNFMFIWALTQTLQFWTCQVFLKKHESSVVCDFITQLDLCRIAFWLVAFLSIWKENHTICFGGADIAVTVLFPPQQICLLLVACGLLYENILLPTDTVKRKRKTSIRNRDRSPHLFLVVSGLEADPEFIEQRYNHHEEKRQSISPLQSSYDSCYT